MLWTNHARLSIFIWRMSIQLVSLIYWILKSVDVYQHHVKTQSLLMRVLHCFTVYDSDALVLVYRNRRVYSLLMRAAISDVTNIWSIRRLSLRLEHLAAIVEVCQTHLRDGCGAWLSVNPPNPAGFEITLLVRTVGTVDFFIPFFRVCKQSASAGAMLQSCSWTVLHYYCFIMNQLVHQQTIYSLYLNFRLCEAGGDRH